MPAEAMPTTIGERSDEPTKKSAVVRPPDAAPSVIAVIRTGPRHHRGIRVERYAAVGAEFGFDSFLRSRLGRIGARFAQQQGAAADRHRHARVFARRVPEAIEAGDGERRL